MVPGQTKAWCCNRGRGRYTCPARRRPAGQGRASRRAQSRCGIAGSTRIGLKEKPAGQHMDHTRQQRGRDGYLAPNSQRIPSNGSWRTHKQDSSTRPEAARCRLPDAFVAAPRTDSLGLERNRGTDVEPRACQYVHVDHRCRMPSGPANATAAHCIAARLDPFGGFPCVHVRTRVDTRTPPRANTHLSWSGAVSLICIAMA